MLPSGKISIKVVHNGNGEPRHIPRPPCVTAPGVADQVAQQNNFAAPNIERYSNRTGCTSGQSAMHNFIQPYQFTILFRVVNNQVALPQPAVAYFPGNLVNWRGHRGCGR